MSEYTPTTDEVCGGWMSSGPPASTVVRALEFARWLDQVKAAARREGQAEAWAEAHAEGCEYVIDRACREFHPNPYEGDRHVDQ